MSFAQRMYGRRAFQLCLVMALFFSGCSQVASSAFHFNVPTQPAIHRFDFSARQGLRDPMGALTAGKKGADTRILVGDGEKVEIFASGTASISDAGAQTGPEGAASCQKHALPLPNLPCYALVYSIGLNGPAAVVGKHVEFTASNDGNLFLGINALNLAKNSGMFHITVLTVPRGTAIGLWDGPASGFLAQGTSVTLSALAYSQNNPIVEVQFSITRPGQPPQTICEAFQPVGNTYSCSWNMTVGGKALTNGKVSFGFTIYGRSGRPLANPDGLRSGTARFVFTEKSEIYAGYDAANFNQPGTNDSVRASWTVPPVRCSRGETSLSAVWVGLSSRRSNTSLLAQTGIQGGCQNGSPQYAGWWEMYPAPATPLDKPVQPGDAITASVTYQAGGFNLVLDDPQQGWHFSTTQKGGRPSDTRFALCIVEAPSLVDTTTNQASVLPLSNFGSVSVSCQVNGKPVGDGPQNDIFQMDAGNAVKATTSPLDPTGATFTVRWQHP